MYSGKHSLFAVPAFIFLALLILISPTVAYSQEKSLQPAIYDDLQPNTFLTRWLVLGPVPVFDGKSDPKDQDTQKKAFEAELFSQHTFKGLKEGKKERIKNSDYTWKLVNSPSHDIDLLEVYGDTSFVIAYAWAEITLPADRSALFGFGSDDGIKVWLNGELVHNNWIGRASQEDDDLVPLNFKKGKNQLLLKVQNMEYGWGFMVRMIGLELFTEKLVLSAAAGNIDGLNILLENGADVNAKLAKRVTALHAAKIFGREDVVKLLLENGADDSIEMPSKETLTDILISRSVTDETPGAAALISIDGKILYKKGFGKADMGNNVPVTPETKFRIGSITKQFTAAAILRLQEEGKLCVSDHLSKYIPDFPRGDEVTIHHLLTHTSGIHSYTNNPDFIKKVSLGITTDELIDAIKKDPYDFNPGEKLAYNNSGYLLLGYLIEKISGKSYAGYLNDTFFDPLGMDDTGVYDSFTILEYEAYGYAFTNEEYQKALNWDMSWAGGAGALYSTVGDLYRWNEAIFNGKVLSKESLDAAFTPTVLNDGSKADMGGAGYGYGWGIGSHRGIPVISHGGGLHGFVSFLLRMPEQKLTVTVLANCAPADKMNPTTTAYQISEIYLWETMEPQKSFATDESIDPAVFKDYVGTYEYPGGAIMTVTSEDGKLFAELTGQPRVEIFPSAKDEFFWKVVEARIVFVRDENGIVTQGIHYQGGAELKVPKFEEEKPADIDPAVYEAYVGKYELAPGTNITISTEDSRMYAQLTGQPRFEVFPRSESVYFLKIVRAALSFQKDDNGTITGVILDQGGSKQTAKKVK